MKKRIFFLLILRLALGSTVFAADDFIDLGILEKPEIITELKIPKEETVAGMSNAEQTPPYLAKELAVVEDAKPYVEPVKLGPVVARMVLALLVVIVLLVGVVLVIKRFGPFAGVRPGGMIKILEHAALAPGKNLHLVQVGSDFMLLASDNNGIVFIKSVQGVDAVSPGGLSKSAQAVRFREALEGKVKGFRPEQALKADFGSSEGADLQANIHDIHAQIEKLKKMKADLL